MTPKFRVWDNYTIGKTEYIVLAYGTGFDFLPEGPVPCYITYDLTRKKVRTFSILGIDRKTDELTGL